MKRHVLSALICLSLASPAFAQEAPPPRKMPRTPVNRESIQEQRRAAPTSREVQGQAIIVDGEKLRIGDIDLRLFGIVPPQLSASFGPQARSALDELTTGQVTTCTIRDRDREERFLATCHNAANADLALELLRRGLAVTARGSVASTDLASTYITAEQAASVQKLGLWSVVIPSAAPLPETPKVDASPTAQAALAQVKKAEEKPAAISTKIEQIQPVKVQEPVALKTAMVASPVDVVVAPLAPGFLARYQLLVTGLIMLITALSLFGAVAIQRLRDRRAEMQAIAAALRGELMAAHAVCRARLRSSVNTDDKDITWPRLRSTLYQAYVGRIGWLGAELARRIASIYGQASDYASYYVGDDESRAAAMPKRQSLQALIQHIDEVLPRLAIIEHTGNPASAGVRPPRPVAVVVPMTQAVAPVATPVAPIIPAVVPSALVSESESTAEFVANPTAEGVTFEAPVALAGEATTAHSIALAAMTNIWGAVQKLARTPWEKKKAHSSRDPIAEYTALIEEEMKRFSFVEEEDESTDQQLPTDPTASGWSPKAHEAL